MEEIALSGILVDDAEKRIDKKGHEYIRFKVGCEGTDMYGKPRVSLYRCYTYDLKAGSLKKGELVFVTGTLHFEKYEERVVVDVYVHTFAKGMRSCSSWTDN